MRRRYAGIGSRKTPPKVLARMERIAVGLREAGFFLESGGATGADSAFSSGAGGLQKVWSVSDATPEALALAARFHPAWDKCGDYARKLHARNGLIILGASLDHPVEFVVCWTPRGEILGGTGQALRLAQFFRIPVFNLAVCGDSFKDLGGVGA